MALLDSLVMENTPKRRKGFSTTSPQINNSACGVPGKGMQRTATDVLQETEGPSRFYFKNACERSSRLS